MDPEYEARLKAEARAYALGASTSKAPKRKLPSTSLAPGISSRPPLASSIASQRSTSLRIHRPDQPPTKLQKTAPLTLPIPPTQGAAASQAQPLVFSETDDDYIKFVKSLGLDDSSLFGGSLDNDDEDEFQLSEGDDEDDDDDDDLAGEQEPWEVSKSLVQNVATPSLTSPLVSSPISLPDFETEMYKSLEEELGSLLEEDMEAAVQSLIPSRKNNVRSPMQGASEHAPKTPKDSSGRPPKPPSDPKTISPATPLRETARQGAKTQVTYQQSQQLRRLLTGHYQLLVQQAVLAVRAAHTQKLNKDKSDFLSGETADDLAEILDGAVGMLQDLDENRKDAIRNSIQLTRPTGAKRSLLQKFKDDHEGIDFAEGRERRLTRAAFTKTLELNSQNNGKRTAFDIPGLMKLKDTFAMIDNSVEGIKGSGNILESGSHNEACKMVLRQAVANVDESYIPGVLPLPDNFSDAKEVFGPDFKNPPSEEQEAYVRRTKNLFTSGEDNLVLRGVNLYGEKQWILIADRYLPDRSVNSISQRYSKLCLLFYKAHGIDIDEKGNLEKPPKLESVDDIDEEKVKALKLTTVEPPAILNVHRWSLDEDLTLLKAVPLMGHMWAELGARLLPHRDRGHLRKRYQVLERRVKATVVRSSKSGALAAKARPTTASSKTGAKTTTRRSPAASSSPAESEPPMSIEKAAASLAFLRPPQKTAPSLAVNRCGSTGKELTTSQPAMHTDTMPPPKNALLRPALPIDQAKLSQTAKSQNNVVSSKAPGAGSPNSNNSLPPVKTPQKARVELQQHDTTSRAAFERLVEGNTDEWSQMSRMKQMLENEDESQAADAIVTHLAKSPGPHLALSRLDQGDSLSGLSMLQVEASKQAANPKAPEGTLNSSIMSRVLRDATKASTGKHLEQPFSSNPPKEQLHEAGVKETVLQGETSKAENSTTVGAPPATPKRANFFSTAGTPIGLSPGFRTSLGDSRPGLALTPNPMYSPAPHSVMRLMSDPSGDELRFSDFQMNEDTNSRPKLDDPMDPVHDPNPPPFASPNDNSLNVQEYDAIEAISALNSLSNSPFRSPKPPRKGDAGGKLEQKKSLFASVIEGVKGKDPKARLEF